MVDRVLNRWPSAGWLSNVRWFRDPGYDVMLTLGVLGLAVVSGGVALYSEVTFRWVLLADVWLLAHPHLAAMYTRLVFKREDRRRFALLLTALPPVVLLATAGAVGVGGSIVLFTGYYFWQTWHYTRQSYGIARAVGGRGVESKFYRALTDAVIYAFPIWGLLHRCAQAPGEFYDSPIALPPVPSWTATLAGAIASCLLVCWTVERIRHHRSFPSSAPTQTFLVLSHVLITMVSFVWVDDITHGWLFINIWHNAQYLVFVWGYNRRRFRGGVQPTAKLVSSLSQRGRSGYYLAACLVSGTLFFLAVQLLTDALDAQIASLVLIVHMTINFHHYVVDAVIWRRGTS